MPITKLLERNAEKWPMDVALVELNPAIEDPRKLSWKEYSLIQSTVGQPYRREI